MDLPHLILALVLVSCHYSLHSLAQDIMGCGGFVKSDVDINFSLVEVKLYTAQGSLKYHTDCTPTTGYYMIPVYDHGDYVLKVEPPPGWTFEPQSVELHIDGVHDACSKAEDIDFQFTGFAVVGKVLSKGQSEGPGGVTLTLAKEGATKGEKKEATSALGGGFTFENVLPGDYLVKATHPRWVFETSSVKVTIASDTGNAGSALQVLGYDVSGSVQSDGEPVRDVKFVLFSSSSQIKSKDVSGCDKTPVSGVTDKGQGHQLCHVTSSTQGKFTFPTVPVGKYTLVPLYKGEHITFDVVPASVEIEVGHRSEVVETIFEVAGFSVQGRVLNAAQGEGVEGAKIYLNGKEEAKTAKEGVYHLDGMKPGTYRLQAKSTDIEFDEVIVRVNPNTPQLPDIIAVRFSLCGKVVIDKYPDGLPSRSAGGRQVTMTTKGSTDSATLTTKSDGGFCTEVKPGTYSLSVVVSDSEVQAGLKLGPETKEVKVTKRAVKDIIFSQFRAKVTGTITCLETCRSTQLSLSAVGRNSKKIYTQANEVSKGATFQFDDVMPGKYRVSLVQDEWCWTQKTVDIEVKGQDVTSGIDFTQSGYILTCSLSHSIKLNFEHESKPGTVGSFDLSKGINKFCLAEPGVYKLRPESCHMFEEETYRYDTASSTILTLTAVKHQVSGQIVTQNESTDIKLTIMSSLSGIEAQMIGPLTVDKADRPQKMDGKDSKKTTPPTNFVYKYIYWARTGETITIKPSSEKVLFYPDAVEMKVSGVSCPNEIGKMEGRLGVFIEGRIEPALNDVTITVKVKSTEDTLVTLQTNAKGTFKVGPLHSHQEYDVYAEKEGYVLVAGSKLGHFVASKLAEIIVKVADNNDKPLSGVLLSLSGGKQYRNNQLSKDDGSRNFLSLSPGQYFIRPMMKEYEFSPASQMIDIAEGATETLKIKAKQVAFSCYGAVTSLNGESETGIIVEVVGRSPDHCKGHQEESKTESDGKYRIRGLQPGCVYDVQIKLGDANKHIERSAPKFKRVTVEKADLHDINIIGFRRTNQLDISGNVITDQKFLSSLKVRLYLESGDSPLHTTNLGTTSFFYLPSVTMDNRNYLLRLESSLSRASYDLNLPEITFKANTSYKHFTLTFNPKHKLVEEQISQSSLLVLPLTALIIIFSCYYQSILPVFHQLVASAQSKLAAGGSSSSRHSPHATSAPLEISPELLRSFNQPSAKKTRARKA